MRRRRSRGEASVTKPRPAMPRVITKTGWIAISAAALAILIGSVAFALTNTSSTAPPGSLPNGDVPPQSSAAVVDDCYDAGKIEPGSITLNCGSGGATASRLTWSRWTADEAIGQGTVNVLNCNPTCASGPDVAYQAGVTLSEPVRAASGARLFTRVTLLFLGKAPAGLGRTAVYKDCFDLPPAPDLPRCPADEQGAT